MKHVTLFVILLIMSGPALADHFGLEQGETLAQIEKITTLRKITPYLYVANSLPEGNTSFKAYRLIVTPNQGLCKIEALTPIIESSVYGEGVKNEFDNIYAGVTTKYGSGKKADYLKTESIWNDPRDWMMALEKRERVLVALWDNDEGSALPPDLDAISLWTIGMDMNHAVIKLVYEFKNFNACDREIKTAENSSL